MQFHSKENPRRVGQHQFKMTTGNGVEGFNPKSNQRGGEQANTEQEPNE